MNKKILKNLVLPLFFLCTETVAQPGFVFTNIESQSSYVFYTLTDFGKFRQRRALQSSGSSFNAEWAFLVNNNFGTCGSPACAVWRHYSSGGTNLAYNTFINPNTTLPGTGALYNDGSSSGNQGAASFLAGTTTNNFYTFNITEDGNVNCKMEVLQTSYNPTTISGVTQSPAGSFVNSSLPVTVTVTTAATPSSGENVYIRYTTDASFDISSTLVQVTMTGATGTATIPAQTAGTVIYYYAFTSPKTAAQIAADVSSFGQDSYDLATIDLQALVENGSGNTNFSYTSTSNPIILNATGGTLSSSYTTLQAAFTNINNGTHQGVISILVQGNTTETGTATLNASGTPSNYTAVSIQPDGGAARSISGSLAGNGIIYFNGADNVTIDGLNSGSNSLTITNSSTSSSASTSAIRLDNDASNNTIQNCSITGSSTGSGGGVIFIGNDAGLGNNSNAILNNTITAAGSNQPLYGILSAASFSAGNNTTTISGNNISDYFNATTSSYGIYLSSSSDAFTITNNRFFQSATRTSTGTVTHRAIYIQIGGGHLITGNTIGYANSGGTGTMSYTGGSARFVGIDVSSSLTSSTISGNTIAGISFSTTSNQGSGTGVFTAINLSSGLATISNNVIGVATTGVITVNSSAFSSGIVINGIASPTASIGTVSITGNTVTAFQTTGSGTSTGFTFAGINVTSSPATYTITGNTVGSSSVSDAIIIGNAGNTTTSNTNLRGIEISATSNPITIGGTGSNGNTIANLTIRLSSSASGSVSGVLCFVSSSSFTVLGNTIHTLNANNNFGVITGIGTNNGNTGVISKNKIYNLAGSGTSNLVDGINTAGGVGSIINVNNNLVGDLRAPSTSSTLSAIQGINVSSTGSIPVNVYYNTVYLEASSSGANFSTNALFANTNPTLDLRNNILINKSTPSGTGRTIAYQRSSTSLTNFSSNSNRNLFYAGTPSSNRLIFYDGINSDQTLAAYKTRVSARDANSVTEDPAFASITGSSSNFLHLTTGTSTQLESGATNITSYTDDFDGDFRQGNAGYLGTSTTGPDIGGDEFDGTLCNVNVVSTGGSILNGCYETLKEAFDAVNAGTQTGTLTITILGNTTETATASLNASGSGSASYTNISIQPQGARTISGSIAGALTTLNGADNVTIDGLNTGGNSLIFSNTNTTATGTILFQADATSNTVQNTTITGSSTSTGVVVFSNGTSTGNDNNTINLCTISAAGSNLPLYGIYSTSGTGETSGVNITNNNISDYFNASAASAGIYVANNNSNWTITGNRLYQSASRTSTGVVTHRAIWIENSTGSSFTISNNIIGYANNLGTGTTIYTSNVDTRFAGIEISASSASTHSIQGNIISGISFTASPPSSVSNSNFYGIALTDGIFNVGTVTGNTIGATTGTGAVTVLTNNSNTMTVAGIWAFSGSGALSIQNNNIGSITVNTATSFTPATMIGYGISALGTRTSSISDNTIGSTTTGASFQLPGGAAINTSFTGIYCFTGETTTINNNTIQNISNGGTGASSTAAGIRVGGTSLPITISGNSIISVIHSGTGEFIGISNSTSASTLTVDDNIVRNITINADCSVFGFVNDGFVISDLSITNNQFGNNDGGFLTYNAAVTRTLFVIYNRFGAVTSSLHITGNDIRGITHSLTGSNSHFYLTNAVSTTSQDISNNTFTGLNVATTGSVTFISNTATLTATGSETVSNNAIVTSFIKSSAGGTVTFYTHTIGGSPSGALFTCQNNSFSNVTVTGSTAILGFVNNDGASSTSGPLKTISGNTCHTITGGGGTLSIMSFSSGGGTTNITGNTISNVSGGSTTTGIGVGTNNNIVNCNTNNISNISAVGNVTGISISGGTNITASQNTISTLSSTATTVTGINVTSSTTATLTQNIINNLSGSASSGSITGIVFAGGTTLSADRNKIYAISSTGTIPTVSGILVSGGSSTTLNNNLIGDLFAYNANAANQVVGINITTTSSASSISLNFNTVALLSSATSTGTTFGSSAVFANTAPLVTMRNNILVNNSIPNGSGLAVVYRRSSVLTSAYSTSSNNNLLYAGTPSSNRLIFYDGTNSDRTLTDYQTRITTGSLPRELNSFTENPNFLSTNGASIDFLHINTAIPTLIEGNATPVSGITDDFDGDTRNVTTPDIGADEFAGTTTCNITVTSTSGSAAPSECYGSLAAAILAINQTSTPYHGGTIVCTVNDGYAETAPRAGYSITREGTSGNTITFTKSGSGSNPVFTASPSQTTGSVMDAVFKLVGADYVTIEKFTIQENSANTTTTSGSNNMTEFGIGIFYTTTTNGAQNNTIQNNTISLNRSYANSFGIYATTQHSATSSSAANITSSSGANNGNKVYANNISNVNSGISFNGVSSASNMDVGNDIGGTSSSTGNTITDWGGASIAASYAGITSVNFGIWLNHQPGGNISYNTITSAAGVSGALSLNGIRLDYSAGGASGTVTNTVSNNTITLNGAASIAFRCIDLGASSGSSVTYNVTNNQLVNSVVTGSSTTFGGIVSAAVINTLNINNNVIRGTTSSATTGGFVGISNSSTVSTTININDNQIGNSSGDAITFSNATSSSMNGITVSGGSGGPVVNITGNNIQGITQTVAGSGAHNYINVSAFTASNNHTITGNTFTNLTANTTGDVYFIQDGSSMASSRTKNISSNSISGSFSKASSSSFSQVYFFSDGSAASSSLSTATFSNNDFSNVTISGNTYLGGWFTQDGSNISKTIQNNIFRNIGGGTNSIEVMTVRGSGFASISGNTIRGISGGGSSVTGLIIGTGIQSVVSNTIRNLQNTGGLVRAIAATTSGSNTIQSNTIDSLYTSASTSIAVGIDIAAGSTINISKNKIYDIANTTASMSILDGAVNGIRVSAGTTVNINNNLVGDLKATAASTVTNVAVRGVNINASTGVTSTTNLIYNTIYLNTSGGSNFSSTGVYQFASATSASLNLDMRNNIIVNLSTPSGIGLTTAFRRSSNTSLNNYATTSNNNLFYAGTPSSTRLIFTDGSTPQQTLSDYITFMSTRDNASVTENVPFLSTSGIAANFLHVDVTNPTVVESGGTPVTVSPPGDFDGEVRFGSFGYSGTGTAPDIGADEIAGLTTAAYWFRTKSSGSNWNNATYWEYSPNGVTWTDATSYPTSAATKINIRNGHTISVPNTVTANALLIESGGVLNHTDAISLTIANGVGNDGSGFDFIVENGGTYVINGEQPNFNTGATAEIRSGGLVRADGNTGGESDDFAAGTNTTFRTNAVMQWNTTSSISTSSVTYFPNSSTSDIPIFRVTAAMGLNGASSFTTFNGKFETSTTGSITWQNVGTKIFRDGFGGTGGTITHSDNCGTFLITGSNAVIDGAVTLNINNNSSGSAADLQIQSGATCTISGSPVINIGTTSFPASLFTVDGSLVHNGTVPVNFQTGLGDFTVNGTYSGTGTLTLNSSNTDITIGGTSGGSAGTFRFTTGSSNNIANNLTLIRTGTGAGMVMGSDFGVRSIMNLASGTSLTIGSNTLTGNGNITGSGTITGSTSSNVTIGGTTGGSFGTLLFTPGAQVLNNFTMGRSGTLSSVTLGTSNNLSVGGVFDITNSGATVVISSNTLTMDGTLTGSGNFTGSASSNITVGGAAGGSLGTMRFATGAQTLNNLTISRTGSGSNAVLGSDLQINNVMDINNSAASFSINGNTLTLAGTITGNGSLSGSTTSNLSMNGTGQVGTLRFTTGAQTLNTISINRTGISNDYAALMASPLTVNAMTLTNGIIATGANLFTWTRTGSLLPAAQTSYTANSTTYKNSYICLCDGSGNALNFTGTFDASDNIGFRVQDVGIDVWFPIGVDFDAPNRMWIDNSGPGPLGTTDEITVLLGKGDVGGTDKPVVRRIWYAYEGTPGGTSANMRLYFTKRDPSQFGISQDEVETGFSYLSDIHLTQKNYGDPNYIDVAQGADILSATSNTIGTEVFGQYSLGVSPDVNSLTDGINQFSRFTVMNISSFILPVTITKVQASMQSDGNIKVSWTAQQETNIDYYEVERSKDAAGFERVGRVGARNNGALEQLYSQLDLNPLPGNNFYRIKIVEKDGETSYSNVVVVVNGSISAVIKVQPNLISSSHAGIQFINVSAGKYELSLISLAGQRLWKHSLQHGGGSAYYDLWLPTILPNGIYLMQITNDEGMNFSQRIMIQK